MAEKYIALAEDLTSVANAIRQKTGESGNLTFPTAFVSAISGISVGLEYESGTWSPYSDTASESIRLTNTHEEAPCFFIIMARGITSSLPSNTVFGTIFIDYYKLWGRGVQLMQQGDAYELSYGKHSLYSTSGSPVMVTTSFTELVTSPTESVQTPQPSDARYYCSNTAINAIGTNTILFRSNKQYDWVAVWKPTT